MNCNPSAFASVRAGTTLRSASTAIMIGVAALALSACKKEDVAAEAPQPVRVMKVKSEPRTAAFSYTGAVRARYESDLGFRVGGKIVDRLVNVGDSVAAGQVLARLDATDLRLAIEANEAELSAARSNHQQAAAAERRAKDLLDRGHVAVSLYDQRKAAVDEAQGRLDRAERNLAIARNQADYATLRADHAGVVTLLPVEIGQVVAAGQLSVRVARDGAREAVVSIPEARLQGLKEARTEVELWAAAEKRRYGAQLREISPQADAQTRTYLARFTILDADAAVALGMTATVLTTAAQQAEVVRVPSSAIINDGRGASVWVVDSAGSRVLRRPVEVASFGHSEVVLSSGLQRDERIVTLGVHILDEAKPVRIVEERAPVKLAAEQTPTAR